MCATENLNTQKTSEVLRWLWHNLWGLYRYLQRWTPSLRDCRSGRDYNRENGKLNIPNIAILRDPRDTPLAGWATLWSLNRHQSNKETLMGHVNLSISYATSAVQVQYSSTRVVYGFVSVCYLSRAVAETSCTSGDMTWVKTLEKAWAQERGGVYIRR